MPRFSLRNQDRLITAFDVVYNKLLLDSLTAHFSANETIVEHEYQNEKYKVIHVDNVQPNTDSFFEFYVISKTYDVYNLAYKSCAG